METNKETFTNPIRILAEWSDYKGNIYCDFDKPIPHSIAEKVGGKLLEQGDITEYDNEGFSCDIGEEISWSDIAEFKEKIANEFLENGYIIVWG